MPNSSRREFLGTLAATTAVSMVAGPVIGATQADRKVKVGLIGCGWWGMVDLQAAYKAGGIETVALCDVDSEHLAKSAAEVEKLQGSRPKTFKNYRDLLAVPGLEAVIIATPPHWHALQFIDACQKGLAIYCEKPLSYDVREGRAMVDAAKKAGNIVQVGFQRRQSDSIKQAAEYIQAGHAGRILHAEAQINYNPGLKDTQTQPPPPSLDWDAWCGPAPKLTYNTNIGHFTWRFEKEYGNGHMVDWGIHWHDAIRLVLGETMPRTIQASGGLYYLGDRMNTPDLLTVHYDFQKCPVTWRHRLSDTAAYSPETQIGMFFYGEKATIFLNDEKYVIIPKEKGKERKVVEAKSDASVSHLAEFLNAVRGKAKPSCTPEDAYYSTATVQLGMIAYQTGAKLSWDKRTEQVSGHPAAAKMLKREYRAPYKHPYKDRA